MIDRTTRLAVVKQCRLLGISRSLLYYQGRAVSEEDLAIMRAIDEIHLARPFLGSRRISGELGERGFTVNRNSSPTRGGSSDPYAIAAPLGAGPVTPMLRIQQLMKQMGVVAVYPKPKTSKAARRHTIYPYLLRGLEPERANQVWVADTTYLPMVKGFAYLVAIMDLYSREILSWQVSNTLDSRFCTAALQTALAHYGAPDIFSDQGAQFTSDAFTGVLERHGVRISMDGKGRWIDNVFIERFWRSLKYEEVYLYAYADLNEARVGLERYFGYYNGLRRHSRLGNRTPDAVYCDSLNNPLRPSLPLPIGALVPRPCS